MRREAWVEKGGVGETRSSRHSRVGAVGAPVGLLDFDDADADAGGLDFLGPEVVIVAMMGEEDSSPSSGEGAAAGSLGWTSTSWKAWMGSASKNSWAIMKGVFSGSIW